MADFIGSYGHPETRDMMERKITQFFRFAGKRNPELITEGATSCRAISTWPSSRNADATDSPEPTGQGLGLPSA